MLFDSLDFAIFLPLVFLCYWLVLKNNTSLQNAFILLASYVFYGWWNANFLLLIALSTLIDFIIGQLIYLNQSKTKKQLFLIFSLVINLGLLGYFKYSNFFLESFELAFTFLGNPINWNGIEIILPVGISFYTFQTMSYCIDIYRGKLKPTRDIIAFSAFVSFFPQLVAGPIERANQLLPQFFTKRKFNVSLASDGLRQILWGLFKKMVVADNCAPFVNQIFNNQESYSGSTLFMGAIIFFIQVYCDFSGYSDIAIGTGRLFGFSLSRNFAYPFFTSSITQFWRTWHISLTTWCRDYIYIYIYH